MESIFLLFPNVLMLFDCPKENLWWSSSTRLLTYWARHSFLHTVLLVAQGNKAELHVSDVKFLSSFGFWKWLWWRTTLFIHSVFSFSLPGRFCAEWLTLWRMAYFVGFPYISNGFLPSFGCGLLVNSCLVILQFGYLIVVMWVSIISIFECGMVFLFFV